MQAPKSRRTAGFPVSSSTPGSLRCCHRRAPVTSEAEAPDSSTAPDLGAPAQAPLELSTLSVGYTTTANDGCPPAAAACQQERHPTPLIRSREARLCRPRSGLLPATLPPRSRAPPTLPSRRPEHLETRAKTTFDLTPRCGLLMAEHLGDPQRSPRRPQLVHALPPRTPDIGADSRRHERVATLTASQHAHRRAPGNPTAQTRSLEGPKPLLATRQLCLAAPA
jgi:hypothetical protein